MSKKVRWLAVTVWMIVIFAFSHQAYSGRETEKYLGDANVPVRKAGHISEYMILYWLVRWALLKDDCDQAATGVRQNVRSRERRLPAGFDTEPSTKDASIEESELDTTRGGLTKPQENPVLKVVSSPTAIAFLVSLAYAGSDEWHQSYVPGRSASLADVTWDTFGISVGMILLFALSRFRKSKQAETEL